MADEGEGGVSKEDQRLMLESLDGWQEKVGGKYGSAATSAPANTQPRSWRESYALVKELRASSKSWPDKGKDKRLCTWFSKQVTAYADGKLSNDGKIKENEKKDLLESVEGWKELAGGEYGWNSNKPPEKTWRQRYGELKEFLQTAERMPKGEQRWPHSKNGKTVKEAEYKLRDWLQPELTKYKNGTLKGDSGITSEEKCRLFNALPGWEEKAGGPYGFAKNKNKPKEKTWREQYDELYKWKQDETKGDDDFPSIKKDGPLGTFSNNMRNKYADGQISPSRGAESREEKCRLLEQLPGWKAKVGGPYGWRKNQAAEVQVEKEERSLVSNPAGTNRGDPSAIGDAAPPSTALAKRKRKK